MTKFIEVDLARIQRDKEEFNRDNTEPLWQEYIHTSAQEEHISKIARFLINTQNGSDIDDSLVGKGTKFVQRTLPACIGKDVLVLGAGTGREMKALRDYGANVVKGITLGWRNAKFAQDKVGEEPIVCDIHAMPYTQDEFDAIVAFHVFEHAYAPVIFLLEMNRVLKTGGAVFMETPDAKGTSTDSWLHHTICPTPRQMFALLLKAGFSPGFFIVGSEHYDVSRFKTERDLPVDWADKSDVHVYVEATKLDPLSYERGDLRRFYEVLSGKPFPR